MIWQINFCFKKFVLRYSFSRNRPVHSPHWYLFMKRKKKITSRALFNICFFLLLKFFHFILWWWDISKRKENKQLLTTNLAPLQNPVKSIRKEKNQIKNVACFLVNVYNSKCTILSSFHSKTRNDLPILLHTTLFPHPTPTTTPYFYTTTI